MRTVSTVSSVPAALETERRSMAHLRDRRPETYAGLDRTAAGQV